MQITPYTLRHGGANEDCAVIARSLEEVQKRGGWKSFNSVRRCEKHARMSLVIQDPTRTSPARAGTRTRPGLTSALNGLHFERRTSFSLHFQHSLSLWHNFQRSQICSSLSGQPGVASTVLVWLAAGRFLGLCSGTPSLNSVQRISQILHVRRFLRACAALRILAGEHSPFDSVLWKRPLRSRLMQRSSFSHVDFCTGGGRFRKRTAMFFIHCGTPSCRSLQ